MNRLFITIIALSFIGGIAFADDNPVDYKQYQERNGRGEVTYNYKPIYQRTGLGDRIAEGKNCRLAVWGGTRGDSASFVNALSSRSGYNANVDSGSNKPGPTF